MQLLLGSKTMSGNKNLKIWLAMAPLIPLIPCLAGAKIIYVDNDGPADFNNIQAAIDANDTKDGDRILVSPGEYIINEPITYRGKNITLKSEEGPEDTIINGNHQIRIFTFNSGETNDAILEGFTIIKGDAYEGGGIYCEGSSPIIRYNIITENEASHGGGIACRKADPLIISNVISNNIGGGEGGGIYCIDSKAQILNNIIKENSVWDTNGGGIACYYKTFPIIKNNLIINNFAYEDGGGIFLGGSDAIIEDNIIARNLTYEDGGGISCGGSRVRVFGNTIINNSTHYGGGGIDNFESDRINLIDNIIYANTPTDLGGIEPDQIFYSDIGDGGFAGINGNICSNPLFADPNNDDYHLKSQAGRWDANEGRWTKDGVTSPCIDAGDPASPVGLEPFPNGGIINMGAYGGTAEASKSYFGEPICETIVAGDINGDCKVDYQDLFFLSLNWLADNRQE